MFETGKYRFLAVLVGMLLLVSACGTSAGEESSISTAVAQTIQAGDSLTAVASLPTATATAALSTLPTFQAGTPVPSGAPTSDPTLSSANPDPNCAKASLVGETPPDNVLVTPGQTFWKTWTLKNTGTCTWTAAYSLVFSSGELMGGLTSYPLNDDVAPGEQKDISIFLKAPDAEGTVTGYWKLQSPWNSTFGVGPSGDPFYVQVNVSNAPELPYGIAKVDYNLVRDPLGGCPTNVRYTLYVTITSNGPFKFNYVWNQSDGNNTHEKSIEFTEAGSKTISREWMVGKGDSLNTRWIEFVVTSPEYTEYGKAEFENLCP
jgi:hypothetical protein